MGLGAGRRTRGRHFSSYGERTRLEAGQSVKKGWVLTPEAFARLLERLSPDPEVAAAEYEATRRNLIGLFRWRGLDCMCIKMDSTKQCRVTNNLIKQRNTGSTSINSKNHS